ncbi:MAG: EFR1 family ferrodoxin [Promethearchaeota archaeon]
MKIALLFFSGTGITAYFATEIAKSFQLQENIVDLIRIKSGSQVDFTQYDIIGIGSPTYSFRAPRLVTRKLNFLNFQKKPFFLFVTSGGMPGNTLWNLYKSVARTGGTCLGFIGGIGITNVRSWMPKLSDSKPVFWGLNSVDCDRAQQFGHLIMGRLKQITTDETNKNSKWIPTSSKLTSLWSLFFTWRWQMALTVGLKHVDKTKCTMCGLCATKICPSGAITLTRSNIPQFNEWKCVGCNGCVNLCPESAIWSLRSKNHHPYDRYSRFILQIAIFHRKSISKKN